MVLPVKPSAVISVPDELVIARLPASSFSVITPLALTADLAAVEVPEIVSIAERTSETVPLRLMVAPPLVIEGGALLLKVIVLPLTVRVSLLEKAGLIVDNTVVPLIGV